MDVLTECFPDLAWDLSDGLGGEQDDNYHGSDREEKKPSKRHAGSDNLLFFLLTLSLGA